jgi:hypothetical protein
MQTQGPARGATVRAGQRQRRRRRGAPRRARALRRTGCSSRVAAPRATFSAKRRHTHAWHQQARGLTGGTGRQIGMNPPGSAPSVPTRALFSAAVARAAAAAAPPPAPAGRSVGRRGAAPGPQPRTWPRNMSVLRHSHQGQKEPRAEGARATGAPHLAPPASHTPVAESQRVWGRCPAAGCRGAAPPGRRHAQSRMLAC